MKLNVSIIIALISACFLAIPAAAKEDTPIIAVASDLQFAMADIVKAYTQDTGNNILISYGSTGNFARQIRQGAPYQLFMAADESYVLALAKDGFLRDEGEVYAQGRIVLVVPTGSALVADGSLQDLKQALSDGRLSHLAIANPDHAPYGQRAAEALRNAGLWDAIQPYLVLGENVSQAAQFALSGNADAGIIAYSLALSPTLASRGSYDLIPEDYHRPLRQRVALTKSAGSMAEAFAAYLKTPKAREIMARHGFVVP